jgi:hypothetical protein
LLSLPTQELVRDQLPAGASLEDLGERHLKDLFRPERVFQLGDDEFAPLGSLYRTNLPVPANPLVGRKKELADVVRLVVDETTRVITITGPGAGPQLAGQGVFSDLIAVARSYTDN